MIDDECEDFGPDLIIEAGDCSFHGKCDGCGKYLKSVRPDQSFDLIAAAWDRHVNVTKCSGGAA